MLSVPEHHERYSYEQSFGGSGREVSEAGKNGGRACADARSRMAVEYAVSRVFGVETADLRRSTRGRAHVARARQVAMYLAHVGFGLTLTSVGRLFERDRTTVAHACSVVEDYRDDANFDRTMELLEWVARSLLSRRGQLG